jgi:ubiquinone/menaquinone biosynthesis C-methylase UbiE
MGEDIEKAVRYWDEHVKIHGNIPIVISWLDSPLVLEQCLKKLKVKNKVMNASQWLLWVKEKYINSKLEYGLSLGCGDGILERHAISLNICSKFDAYDISEKSIEIAKCSSEKESLSTCINYQVADINEMILSENKYDVVFAGSALHHFSNLEHIFEEIRKSLKPNGFFVFNEFVGPSQFQWSEKQLKIMNELLEILPNRYKVDVTSGRLKERIYRPSIEYMNETDPSEAIRSSEIVPLVIKYFDIEERVDYGGTILHMLLHTIVSNFDPSKEEDVAILRLLRYIEDILIEEKILPSDFTLIVARNNKSKLKTSVGVYKNIEERKQCSTSELQYLSKNISLFSRFTLYLKENGLRYTAKRTFIYIKNNIVEILQRNI